jgi:hypothetical protein
MGFSETRPRGSQRLFLDFPTTERIYLVLILSEQRMIIMIRDGTVQENNGSNTTGLTSRHCLTYGIIHVNPVLPQILRRHTEQRTAHDSNAGHRPVKTHGFHSRTSLRLAGMDLGDGRDIFIIQATIRVRDRPIGWPSSSRSPYQPFMPPSGYVQ